jgi:hypothetical protein
VSGQQRDGEEDRKQRQDGATHAYSVPRTGSPARTQSYTPAGRPRSASPARPRDPARAPPDRARSPAARPAGAARSRARSATR